VWKRRFAGAGAAVVALFFPLIALARPGAAGLGDAKLGLSTAASIRCRDT
jgi:hypothetical protein